MDPRISLALDNCFASKRWTRPCDWMPLIRDLGITLVEASADTECDPLHMGSAYVSDWVEDVHACAEQWGIRVVNLYSGHGTYSTLGLAHTDNRVRNRFRDRWLKSQAKTAKKLDAGLGFFAHAIPEAALQDPALYNGAIRRLYGDLSELAAFASNIGLSNISVEQMYTPHQPPWTIRGARELLQAANRGKQAPFFLTLDIGHMNGQSRFQKPVSSQIEEWISQKASDKDLPWIWLGPRSAMDIGLQAVNGHMTGKEALDRIQSAWQPYDHLFAEPQDGSVHAWLEVLSGYSPIIHLQQSDGTSSPHWPFSQTYNKKGIIKGDEVLRSIERAYSREQEEGMPPMVDEIMLTLEPFVGTADHPYDALEQIGQSIAYWRQFVPRDGMRLSEIIALLDPEW